MDSRGAYLLDRPGLAELCARPVTAATLAALEAYDPDQLCDAEQVLYLRAVQRAESHFAGRRLASVARLARGVEADGETVEQSATVAEVGIALRVAPGTAVNEIHRARRLARDLPDVLAAMDAGDLTYCQTLAVLDASRTVDEPRILDAVQHQALATAGKSAGVLGRALRRLIARLDPDSLERRHTAARKQSDVTLQPAEDAMAHLSAYLPLPDATIVHQRVEDYARKAKAAGDKRPLGMLRCEALVKYCTGTLDPGGKRSRSHGRPVELQIVTTPETLLGLSNLPGEVPGVGPVTASLIREMAADARLRWLTISAENGRLLDRGVKTYRFPAAMAAEINATWVTSVGPHSTVPATRCDIDHVIRHPEGPTSTVNGVPLDRRTHIPKTFAGLKLTRRPDGLLEWSTPLGQTLIVEPWDYRQGP